MNLKKKYSTNDIGKKFIYYINNTRKKIHQKVKIILFV